MMVKVFANPHKVFTDCCLGCDTRTGNTKSMSFRALSSTLVEADLHLIIKYQVG